MGENRVKDENAEDAPAAKKIEELYGLIEEMEIAMMTTRRADGRLVSRPMATQKRDPIADLWFVTDGSTHKLDEIEDDPQVNLAYYNMKTREWVSVSGRATVSRDREQIRRLHQPDWRAWFPNEGGNKDGGPEDPRLTLILVDVESVTYLEVDKPRPVVLFEVLKGMVTGSTPRLGKQRELSGAEMD